MTTLPDDLRAALAELARTPRLLVASDFDGCLAPIVSDPAAAAPDPRAVDALVALAAMSEVTVAAISGRDRKTLRALSGLPPQIELVGSHGAEFAAGFDGGIDKDALALHAQVAEALRGIVDGVGGTSLESKPASVAVHVRNASADDAQRILDEVRAGPATWDGVYPTEGKSMIELAVLDTDKGQALDVLRAGARAGAAIYFGDDVTDEKAFRRMDRPDVAVKVGDGDTAAAFRVAGPAAVTEALELLRDERRLQT